MLTGRQAGRQSVSQSVRPSRLVARGACTRAGRHRAQSTRARHYGWPARLQVTAVELHPRRRAFSPSPPAARAGRPANGPLRAASCDSGAVESPALLDTLPGADVLAAVAVPDASWDWIGNGPRLQASYYHTTPPTAMGSSAGCTSPMPCPFALALAAESRFVSHTPSPTAASVFLLHATPPPGNSRHAMLGAGHSSVRNRGASAALH